MSDHSDNWLTPTELGDTIADNAELAASCGLELAQRCWDLDGRINGRFGGRRIDAHLGDGVWFCRPLWPGLSMPLEMLCEDDAEWRLPLVMAGGVIGNDTGPEDRYRLVHFTHPRFDQPCQLMCGEEVVTLEGSATVRSIMPRGATPPIDVRPLADWCRAFAVPINELAELPHPFEVVGGSYGVVRDLPDHSECVVPFEPNVDETPSEPEWTPRPVDRSMIPTKVGGSQVSLFAEAGA